MRQLCTLDYKATNAAIAGMHDISVKISWPNGKKSIEAFGLPEKWSEVPPRAWPLICNLLLMGKSQAAQLRLLYSLARRKNSRKRISKNLFYLLSLEQLELIIELMGWMFDQKITAPPVAYFKIKRRRYYLPQAELQYISLAEYAFADFYFEMYKKAATAGDTETAEDHLNSLLATLCRPLDKRKKPNDAEHFAGDIREKYNGVLSENRKPLMAKLPVATKLAVLMFFSGCKSHLHEQYKGLVWIDMVDDKGQPVINAKAAQPQEWIDLTFSLAGGKFGTLPQTMETHLHTVLHELVLQNQKAA